MRVTQNPLAQNESLYWYVNPIPFPALTPPKKWKEEWFTERIHPFNMILKFEYF